MTEKRYLKWYNKVGYGSGDIAGNVVYAFLSSFVMIYLTNTVGLNPGIVGTLIAVSKLLDGVTDIFFGSLIDKTHSKMGKARPWMLYGYIGCAITLVAIFAIPANLGQFAQYAWFLIAYTLLNAVFYTANNIAYSALTAHPVHHAGCCYGIGRWCCRLAHCCNHLRHHRSACQHPLRFLREGTAGRRIGGYHRQKGNRAGRKV